MCIRDRYYFNPGNTGFKVWDTNFGKIGIGICWDQWFPEAARIMVLKGADILFYPTAIGNELRINYDSSDAWQRAMQGHAVSNIVPVVASNRIGTEEVKKIQNRLSGALKKWMNSQGDLGQETELAALERQRRGKKKGASQKKNKS